MKNFTIGVEEDGLANVVFDVPGRSMNTITTEAVAELGQLAERLRSDDAIKCVLIRSGKEGNFCAGADIGDLMDELGRPLGADDRAGRLEKIGAISRALRGIETCGKPVAVALEGLALGGGFELVLAGHYRVAADSDRVRLGLPEVTIGLLPGAGGTQRLPRLAGIAASLPMLLQGKPIDARKAKELGVVDALVPVGEAVSVAAAWLRSASLRTSAATTAKPLPWSPARAASMAAFSANRLVW